MTNTRINPQPEPPGTGINSQPEPPGLFINPQPEPPGILESKGLRIVLAIALGLAAIGVGWELRRNGRGR